MILPDLGDTSITTRRLDLSALTVEDADEMVTVLADHRLHRFTGGRPDTLDQLRQRYRRFVDGPNDPDTLWLNWIVRLQHGRSAIGTLQATVTVPSGTPATADVGWIIGTSWQGHGYASEAARAVVAWLNSRGVLRITAHIHPDHQASAAVAGRAGMRPTADHHDGETVWLSTRQCPPPE